MYIRLENINKIKSAKIKLGGLTVLAGENDTGKSTVGKMLFSVIKALVGSENDFDENKTVRINSLIEKLFITGRRYEPKNEHDRNLFRKEFYPPYFLKEIERFIDILSIIPERDETGTIDAIKRELNLLLDEKKNTIQRLFTSTVEQDRLIKFLNDIKSRLTENENEADVLKKTLDKVFNSEFYSKIKSQEAEIGSIELGNEDCSAEIIINTHNKISINAESVKYRPFEDATFIESPLYVQLKNVFDRMGTLYDLQEQNKYSPKISLDIKDLMRKIEYAKYFDRKNENKFSSLTKKIKDTIDGEFIFDKSKDDFVFRRKIGEKEVLFEMNNVASGIKVFGIIQLLVNSREIGIGKMLILDEPENHLHPRWQLIFAQLLVLLVRQGIPILLTSHSPYFIQALNYYASKEKIENDVSFYLAESTEDGMTNIEEVTNDLNRIFIKLAEPFREIY